eukprot:1159529-Pelagomonas_calceolata.AAC.7
MEILCFMSGIDPMTSNSLQARHGACHQAESSRVRIELLMLYHEAQFSEYYRGNGGLGQAMQRSYAHHFGRQCERPRHLFGHDLNEAVVVL